MSNLPIPAATVMLIAPGPVSPRVLLIERHPESEVLPAMSVFPGGRVDPEDHALAPRLYGLEAHQGRAELLESQGLDVAGLFVAAMRETFEEAGLLLARPRGGSDLIDPAWLAPLRAERLAIQQGNASFGDLLERHDWMLAADRLVAHARWITPVRLPLRFDTVFFTAEAPLGQCVDPDGVETSAHVWIRPEDALAERARGERPMIFPTACNLETLAGFSHATQVIEASRGRPFIPIEPEIREIGGAKKLVIPREAGYPTMEEPLESLEKLRGAVRPAAKIPPSRGPACRT